MRQRLRDLYAHIGPFARFRFNLRGRLQRRTNANMNCGVPLTGQKVRADSAVYHLITISVTNAKELLEEQFAVWLDPVLLVRSLVVRLIFCFAPN